MRRLLALALLLILALSPQPGSAEPDQRSAPSRADWIQDVRAVMKGSGAYLRERTESGDERLAVNFDIDNSAIATYYDGRDAGAIPRVLRFARRAQALGVQVFFNTARTNGMRERTLDQLSAAGYDVDRLCMRRQGETLPQGKQRCRAKFAAKGFTLIANVGNNPTDFVGGGFEKAYRLPNYGGELG